MEKPIYNEFVEFVKSTFGMLPEQLSELQHEQLKMAFYGGALTVHNIFAEGVTSRDTDLLVAITVGLLDELTEYGKEMDLKG